MKRKLFFWFAMPALLGVVVGCSGGEISADTARDRQKAISDANKEGMAKNPPPPGEGPSR